MDAAFAAAECRAGIAAYGQGDYRAAAGHFSRALAAIPEDAAARINLANALWSLGAYAEAAAQAARVLAAHPDSAEAWMITGAIRLDRGDAAGARLAYAEAVRLRPIFGPAHAGLAAALLAEGEAEAAERAAEAALRLLPGNTHPMFTLASAKLARHQPEAALQVFDALLEVEPGHARAWHNRGNALIDLGRLEAAEAALRESLARDPALKEAWATLGYLLTVQGELDAAVAACDRAIALDADFAAGQWNRGVALLLNGDLAGGFAAYEWRKRHPVFRHHFTKLPGIAWGGQNLAGRHLLVRAEQGFGDTIMLARFLPRLAAQAGQVTLACAPTLFPLFRDFGLGLCGLDADPRPDFSVDQMSLPLLLRITESTIPLSGGYLRADPARAVRLLPELPAGARVGLVWAGNPGHDNDRHRSLPRAALAPLLRLPGLRFVSLQLGPRQHEYPIAGVDLRDYGDTAAVLSGLDAVVTVDTSVAHLAGAMGVPCHVLLSKACDWRWRLGRNGTAWYDSLTLHRQERLDDWSAPIASVIDALGQRFSTATMTR